MNDVLKEPKYAMTSDDLRLSTRLRSVLQEVYAAPERSAFAIPVFVADLIQINVTGNHLYKTDDQGNKKRIPKTSSASIVELETALGSLGLGLGMRIVGRPANDAEFFLKLVAATSHKVESLTGTLDGNIEDIPMSVRLYNALHNADVKTIGELQQPEPFIKLLKQRNFGLGSYEEVCGILSNHGLKPGWPVENVASIHSEPTPHQPPRSVSFAALKRQVAQL